MGDSFSAMEDIKYCGGIVSVHVDDNISTVGNNISNLKDIFSKVEKEL